MESKTLKNNELKLKDKKRKHDGQTRSLLVLRVRLWFCCHVRMTKGGRG